jgi:hypothetical protein
MLIKRSRKEKQRANNPLLYGSVSEWFMEIVSQVRILSFAPRTIDLKFNRKGLAIALITGG